ncbi:hypothetical protein LB523_14215 [Mesorhizobium sp. ESP-6-4]|uniref:hypothetical protein n=1 Tax=unclassified Mesorhizobium TaxID=325217 RepID=UPI001CCF8F8D|nr:MULTISPECIES: hypothetical protein [unclassified Mesorhizobium]MBZ9660205.1 hypothetical protein [Mesorhizobium sp. ESP-6-4]MBZ9859189.1 hypothetical protein [Mesorhizobium sp. CA12]
MNQDIRTLLFRLSISALASVVGVVFRPFWLSYWGMPTFIFLAWLTISVALGWVGRSQPNSFRFGFIAGSGFASSLIATVLTKSVVVGAGLLIALAYIGIKTKFFARWGGESGSHPKQ